MATTSSTAGTGANDSSTGSFEWISPTNAQGTANGVLTNSAADGVDAGLSYRLKGTNFSFDVALATAASIQGITVVIKKKRQSFENCKDSEVKLMKSSSVVGSNYGATGTNWATTLTDVTYGGVADLWGTTWSGSDFTSTFGVGVIANLQTADANAFIDSITVTVTYTVGGDAVVDPGSFSNRRGNIPWNCRTWQPIPNFVRRNRILVPCWIT